MGLDVSRGLLDVSGRRPVGFRLRRPLLHRSLLRPASYRLSTQAMDKCKAICAQMDEMKAGVSKPARNPEHAVELRQYFKTVTDNVGNLRPEIAELPADCELLDEFLHMLPDEEDKWRWTTYSWPLKMEEEIEKGIERCEESENAFQSMMVAKQQSFAKEI